MGIEYHEVRDRAILLVVDDEWRSGYSNSEMTAASARKRPYAILTLLMIAALSCVRAEEPKVEIDLTRIPSCLIGNEFEWPPVEESRAVRGLLQNDARPLDLFLRLPSQSVLRFSLPELGSTDNTRVSVRSDRAERDLVWAASGNGGYAADLSNFDEEVVRLRFENSSGAPVIWLDPRVEGSSATEAVAPVRVTKPPDRPLNVLLYVIDALRADHLSIYGYGLPTSPRLAQLAQRGAVFLNAYSTSSNTMNSIAPLLTSVQPSEAFRYLRSPEHTTKPTLAEAFRDGGWATAAFQANPWVRPGLGFGRGFEEYAVLNNRWRSAIRKTTAELLHARVLRWLDGPGSSPFFLYVQSMDVHSPYAPPEPFRGRFSDASPTPKARPADLDVGAENAVPPDRLEALLANLQPHHYDDAVAYADHQLGVLLDALGERGLRESTIIVVTADHGEALGERGRYLHGVSLHEEQTHIPLILLLPGDETALRPEQPVSLLDLGPTLLDLVGLPIPEHFQGSSLLRRPPPGRTPAAVGELGHNYFVREGPFKLVVSDKSCQLHDLRVDREEVDDVSASRPVQAAYMKQILWERSVSFRDPEHRALPIDKGISEEERRKLNEALRALGYIE
jgi:arylsulfatase A-like enzyme